MKKIFTILIFALFVIPANTQNFDFQWQNPKISGNTLNDALTLPNGKIVAVGEISTFRISEDGGNSWSAQMVDVQRRGAKAAFFVNNTTGYICGEGGMILKTTDGGATFTAQTSNTAEVLWDIEFQDENTGYAAGAAGVMLKTTNGGDSWQQITVPVSNIIYAVHIVSPTNIFMGTTSTSATQILNRSTDGGLTWQNVTPAGFTSSVYAIKFVDTVTGYVACSSGKVLKTSNGGETFAEITDFGSNANYSLAFTDSLNGYVPSGSEIYKTTDAGATWTLLSSAFETLRGITFQGGNVIMVGSYGSIYKSTDQGATWAPMFSTVTTDLIREIHFVNSDTGYACSGSTTTADSLGYLLKTTDGGNNWVKMPFNFTYQVYSLAMPSANVWYAGTGNNKIFKTTDAGGTWIQQTQPVTGTTHDFYEIGFADENNLYAGGLTGKLIKTTNGGTNWTNVVNPFGTSAIYDLHVFDANNVLAVGISAKAYKTTDGGTTWNPVTTGIPGNYFSVEFLNNSFGVLVGYASGSAPNIAITTDGGTTWTPQSVPTSFDVFASVWGIGILDVNRIWISDLNGEIGYTADGGTTWVRAKPASSNGLYDIAIVGADMWMAGSGGSIIKGFSDPAVPVELVSFTYAKSADGIILSWKTGTETNNKGFEVERNYAGSWKTIGFVQGAGNSVMPLEYSFTDGENLSGKVLYRLKQIDYDGTITYSGVIEIDASVPLEFSLSQNYPNPFNPSTVIRYSVPVNGLVTLKVYDMIGRSSRILVNSVMEAGEHSVSFDASSLSSGVYFYELTAGNFRAVKKMLLIK